MAEISSSMEIGVASDHSPNSLTSMRSIRIYSNEPQLQKMWLDVLCIPRGSSHKVYRNERRRAIEKIDWTFARARRVLVRDKLLNNLRTETMSTMEVAAYLCCAKWLRRCWTLAEGALAWDFSIQFADRTLNFLDILKMAEAPFEPDLVVHGHFRADNREEFDIVLQRRLQTGLLAAFQRIPYSKENNTWENRSLTKSWNTLSARSTSMPTDTPLILGLLMKVSIKDLTNLDHSLRMKAILKTLAKIPAALLFNKSPKVECKPRNRWVPLNQASADQLEPGPLMGLFNEGRMVGPIMARMFTMFSFESSVGKRLSLSSPNLEMRGRQGSFRSICEGTSNNCANRSGFWFYHTPTTTTTTVIGPQLYIASDSVRPYGKGETCTAPVAKPR
ncbi:hypothetical protein COCHEDRAFT_1208631 [Bipolaris maydis C5]|uniref:Heterokaryon incompatibility domain-containing protein n=1 Tax=Cochliobolus heterostrophus (strain C5 / ATCC 48332 / race O) TaxID=701091 RepID=M2TH02_COCH5|nr:hypothetical protein COCHEDRAFT_1208631 [Bipolaris maydis C5]KAJ5060564.1 hypothetical protein J3E74DRAFT_290816 [Bipolaris maydis]KAJ6201610.1 hypothetical protein J3E72DRAFT_370578 [Bipolaris maydis]